MRDIDKYSYIKDVFQKENIELSDSQIESLIKYYEILVDWNSRMNLTAITEFEDVVYKHFLDSIVIKNYYDFNGVNTLIDIGTGAGFPGIPLKIVFPEIRFTLLDSLNKRIVFLDEVVSSLGLSDIELIHGRAEDFGRDPRYREKYDLCVSRAVSNMSTLLEYCLPFVKPGGLFIPYKSGKVDEELLSAKNAVSLLSANVAKVEKFTISDPEMSRSFVFVKKMGALKAKYPRLNNLPKKDPL